MKYIVWVVTGVILLLAINAFMGSLPAAGKSNSKVTICHATSSEKKPYIRIVVSENAIGGHFDNPGSPKAGHEDDVLLKGDVDCPTPKDEQPVDETPTPPAPTPVPPTTPPTTPPVTPPTTPETPAVPAAPVALPSVGPDGR